MQIKQQQSLLYTEIIEAHNKSTSRTNTYTHSGFKLKKKIELWKLNERKWNSVGKRGKKFLFMYFDLVRRETIRERWGRRLKRNHKVFFRTFVITHTQNDGDIYALKC